MARFKFTYPDGTSEEYEMSDCETVEDAANTHLGSNRDDVQVELIPEGG